MAEIKHNPILTQQYVREALNYDPVSGIFMWRVRPLSHFSDSRIGNSWNAKHSGTCAGRMSDNGYWVINVGGSVSKAHRLAWLYMHGWMPDRPLDHKNTIKADNRISNLREANNFLNQLNVGVRRDNKLGIKGVYQVDSGYKAEIRVHGRKKSLGVFPTAEDASRAYRDAYIYYAGDFAHASLRPAESNQSAALSRLAGK